jgi:hypothetical protein
VCLGEGNEGPKGFVEILELGRAPPIPKAVTYDEEPLPAAKVYWGVYGVSNSTGAVLKLSFLQAYLHPTITGSTLFRIELSVTYRELID